MNLWLFLLLRWKYFISSTISHCDDLLSFTITYTNTYLYIIYKFITRNTVKHAWIRGANDLNTVCHAATKCLVQTKLCFFKIKSRTVWPIPIPCPWRSPKVIRYDVFNVAVYIRQEEPNNCSRIKKTLSTHKASGKPVIIFIGVRARGLGGGLQPPDSGKAIIFRAKASSRKWKNCVFVKRKKRIHSV